MIFKKKKPWVRFYSVDAGVAELQPWIPAAKLHRKWRTAALKNTASKEKRCPYLRVTKLWERMSAELRGDDSIPELYEHAVTCPALRDVMDSGYVLKCPADILIKTDGTGVNFQWISQMRFCTQTGGPGNPGKYVSAHIPEQTEGVRQLVNQQKDVLDWTIKLELPWRVQAHPDIVFIQMPIPYWDEDRFTPPTGVVDPSYSYEINLQLFWHKIEEGEYLIKAGTPLCQWVPVHRSFLSNRNIDFHCETANEADFENNAIMEYQRHKHFMEMETIKERIASHKVILALNKNIKRFM
jgi:hypothetical protein